MKETTEEQQPLKIQQAFITKRGFLFALRGFGRKIPTELGCCQGETISCTDTCAKFREVIQQKRYYVHLECTHNVTIYEIVRDDRVNNS